MSISTSSGELIKIDGEWKYKIGTDLKNIEAPPKLSEGPNQPTVLYNAMINPLTQFRIRGVIWYQGESNVHNANQYAKLFPSMITDWRKQWDIGDFPFYYVQLANYMNVKPEPSSSTWAELRDAQLKTLYLPNTGMAVAIDVGDANDIHPKNKQEIGRRLSLIALAQTYGYKKNYSGPIYDSFQIDNDKVKIKFKLMDDGLKVRGNTALQGFSIAGKDRRFYWAKATICGGNVVVSSDNVSHPVAVRYGWADNPICNLCNNFDLPASPFRTDKWND